MYVCPQRYFEPPQAFSRVRKYAVGSAIVGTQTIPIKSEPFSMLALHDGHSPYPIEDETFHKRAPYPDFEQFSALKNKRYAYDAYYVLRLLGCLDLTSISAEKNIQYVKTVNISRCELT